MVELKESRIPGFVQLGDITSLYQPKTGGNNGVATLENKQSEPDLIVFCSWMSAAPKHIAKYTAGYQRLFPNTAILLIEAKLRDMFTPNPHTAATSIISTYIESKAPLAHRTVPSIILHASSNGGGNSAATLATELKWQGYAAPFDAVTLDCSPGKAEIQSSARAIRLSMPDVLFLREISSVLIYVCLFGYMLYCEGLGNQNKISWIRETLNDRAVLGVNVPRLYLSSKGDKLVEVAHIHDHAVEAASKGAGDVVAEEVFERAPHCALLNEDAGRYWGAVEKIGRREVRRFEERRWAWVGEYSNLN